MSKITLGTVVKFDQISSVEYEPYSSAEECPYGRGREPRKLIVKKKLKAPFTGMVIGKVKRATGKYGRNNDEPNCLVIDKYHDFYEVRASLTNKPFMVHPDDISLVSESKVEVPNRNDLVFDEKPSLYSSANGGGDFVDIEEVEEGLLRIKAGSCCVYSHDALYPTEYLTRLLEYAHLNLTPEQIFKGWKEEYVAELMGKIKNG